MGFSFFSKLITWHAAIFFFLFIFPYPFFLQFLLLGLIIISWPVFTEKVYKRGALGRSIDMARYSGYAELKQDLARRFGIEGQLEDQQRIGWKLVYMDHDDDGLLVGEDPWEVFVNCVRCIKILSLEEVSTDELHWRFWEP